jgi:hypothetical protein
MITATAAAASLLAACSGDPVQLGTRSDQPLPKGAKTRDIQSSACGFQLLWFIPININGRQQTAYNKLLAQANGDAITDVQVGEHWFYGFAGTGYCTDLHAKAVTTD